MSEPKRIQLRRTKGWRKPEGAIVVARPSKWGNPFQRATVRVGDDVFMFGFDVKHLDPAVERAILVAAYRQWFVEEELAESPEAWAADLAELRGHDLACWCPLDQPCHADVLLELANGGVS